MAYMSGIVRGGEEGSEDRATSWLNNEKPPIVVIGGVPTDGDQQRKLLSAKLTKGVSP